jgi:hypothetical protein
VVERLDAADAGADLPSRRKISPVVRMMVAARATERPVRDAIGVGYRSVDTARFRRPLSVPGTGNGKAPQVRGFPGI